ncbi:hypothetical protein ALP26_103491 [Pseudomonas savastanoi pv. glycinea]|uniref:Uncharacterized protein n=13 Tax=Pseudomonas syringae group TaxID=136849 RepID=A0AAX1VV66_PSEAJ|nr:hypothetical protein ALO90_102834 [Pseudomonas amygdali pv. aesculi]KPW29345.1 hypothetical protein ALO51_102551 [Pseudomonas amygdali]KPW69152.1 hypothetical protein ALO82_102630 [Pseudomonas syringae pv. broussonetiae]KPW72274.1 hypothetical protein ALO78_102372 [Pseudomonas amygdali pv. ciccaronei]KPW92896.1 hypothetical protein ALO79_100748 [Pseudomonas syringae pv. castaneae]KPX02615.1 hypothetical protein ALO74_102642 [Pseudomonas syringae pv. cunninghamiae]KPX12959.1 hypothetical pr
MAGCFATARRHENTPPLENIEIGRVVKPSEPPTQSTSNEV